MNEQEEFEFRLRLEQEQAQNQNKVKTKPADSPLQTIGKSAIGMLTEPFTVNQGDIPAVVGGLVSGTTQGLTRAAGDLLSGNLAGGNVMEMMKLGANSANMNNLKNLAKSPESLAQNYQSNNFFPQKENAFYPSAATPKGAFQQFVAEQGMGLLTGGGVNRLAQSIGSTNKINKALENAAPLIEGSLQKNKYLADKVSAQKVDLARKQFTVANEKLTTDYGRALKDKGFYDEKISHSDFNDLADRVMKKAGIDRSKPDLITPEQSDFVSWVQEKLKQSRKTDDIFGVQRSYAVDGKDIYEKLKSMKSSLGTRIWSAFNDEIGTMFPKLKEVRTEFAPRIQDKVIAQKIIKPYMPSGKTNDISTPYTFYTKIATGKANESTKRMADALDRFLGEGHTQDLRQMGDSSNAQEMFLRYLKKRSGEDSPSMKIAKGIAKKIGRKGVSMASGGLL